MGGLFNNREEITAKSSVPAPHTQLVSWGMI